MCNESVTLKFMGTVSNPVDKTVLGSPGAVAVVPPLASATSSARSKRAGEVAEARGGGWGQTQPSHPQALPQGERSWMGWGQLLLASPKALKAWTPVFPPGETSWCVGFY